MKSGRSPLFKTPHDRLPLERRLKGTDPFLSKNVKQAGTKERGGGQGREAGFYWGGETLEMHVDLSPRLENIEPPGSTYQLQDRGLSEV